MAEYLLDSDVVIWCLRGRPDDVAFVKSLAEESLPACSAMTVMEVELGMRKGEESGTLQFLDSFRVVPVTKEIARIGAAYVRTYAAKGRKIDFVDALIASTCALGGFVLVTYNLRHYPMPEVDKRAP